MEHCDILIIGAGAAGIAAAKASGDAKVLLVDYRSSFGGILRQCFHKGFGNHLTGPEYIEKITADIPSRVTVWFNTTVLSVSDEKTATLANPSFGQKQVRFRQLILATGSRERPLGMLPIAGTRPKGVYTAGQMQEMVNLFHHIPRDPVVILGSGDLGLIMANHLAEAGCRVTIIEQKESCSGMRRNQKCLQKFPIRLLCNTTVSELVGTPNLEGVILSDGTCLPCQTLLLAVGLVPDQELIQHLKHPDWLHLCGNCSTIHPMVEQVISDGTKAGLTALKYMR